MEHTSIRDHRVIPQIVACGVLASTVTLLVALVVGLGLGSQTARSSGAFAFGSQTRVHKPAAFPAARRRALASAYGRIPMSFEANRGQSDPRMKYEAHGVGYSLALTAQGPLLALTRPGAGTRRGSRPAVTTAVLATRFVSGSASASLLASRLLAGRVNYLIGKDTGHWHTGVPTYATVSYREEWPGIDVAFHGNQSQLEYDFLLQPHADPGQIALRLSGARRLSLDHNGSLVVGLHGGSLRILAPRAYQTIAGARRPVSSRYAIAAGGLISIRLGGYDHARALVIDPTVPYSTYLGGAGAGPTNGGAALGYGIAVDAAGNAYVTGYAQETDFPTTPGALQATYPGSACNGVVNASADGFVTKLNSTGTSLIYSTYLGGPSPGCTDTTTYGIAVDSAGHAYVTGRTSTPNFPNLLQEPWVVSPAG